MSIYLTVSPSMNLGNLAEAMGPATTEDEATAMRDLLVETYDGEAIRDIDEKVWIRLCRQVATRTYQIAFAKADGTWDVVKQFEACGDDAANTYAEEHYPDAEWYVLCHGRNINA